MDDARTVDRAEPSFRSGNHVQSRTAEGGVLVARAAQSVPSFSLDGDRMLPVVNPKVIFKALSETRCRVQLQLEYEPEGAAETLGDWLGIVSGRIEGDLQRFKRYIEERGVESGGWRGEIHQRNVSRGA